MGPLKSWKHHKKKVKDGLILVAEAEGKIVGTVMGGYDGHRGWIYSLAVLPEFRRKGIATQLLKHIENEMVALGCLKLNLQVRAHNTEVINLYEKYGYKTEEIVSLGKQLY